jgi:hypothetical protein
MNVDLVKIRKEMSMAPFNLLYQHGVISQKKILFETTAVKTSNPTRLKKSTGNFNQNRQSSFRDSNRIPLDYMSLDSQNLQ